MEAEDAKTFDNLCISSDNDLYYLYRKLAEDLEICPKTLDERIIPVGE